MFVQMNTITMQKQSVYKIPAILYANRIYWPHSNHIDGLVNFEQSVRKHGQIRLRNMVDSNTNVICNVD